MDSLISYVRSAVRGVDLFLMRRFGRLNEINDALAVGGRKYLDKKIVSLALGISEDEAITRLKGAAKRGDLKAIYIFSPAETGGRFVVSYKDIGEPVRLADLGVIDCDEDEEIPIEGHRVKEAYIVPRTA